MQVLAAAAFCDLLRRPLGRRMSRYLDAENLAVRAMGHEEAIEGSGRRYATGEGRLDAYPSPDGYAGRLCPESAAARPDQPGGGRGDEGGTYPVAGLGHGEGARRRAVRELHYHQNGPELTPAPAPRPRAGDRGARRPRGVAGPGRGRAPTPLPVRGDAGLPGQHGGQ